MRKTKISTIVLGFLCTFCAINSVQAAECPICYRCTAGTEKNCYGSCVPDDKYCNVDYACEDGEVWSAEKNACVSIGDVEKEDFCLIGFYYDSATGGCVACPSAPSTTCTLSSTGQASDGIKGCYLVGNTCTLSDAAGTYTYSSDCYYN